MMYATRRRMLRRSNRVVLIAMLLLIARQGSAHKPVPMPSQLPAHPETIRYYETLRRDPICGPSMLAASMAGSAGYITADLPWRVKQGDTFNIDLWLVPSNPLPAAQLAVTVYMEQTDSIQYDPRIIDIRPGQRKTIKAKVLSSPSGLTEIIASADGWDRLSVSIDSGFQAQFSPSIPAEILSGSRDTFSVQFVGKDNKLLALDAPVSVILETTSAEIRTGDRPWSRSLEIPIARGANSTPLIEIRASSWPPSRGFVKADIKINSQQIIGTQAYKFQIVPS